MKNSAKLLFMLAMLLSGCNTGRHAVDGIVPNAHPVITSPEGVRIYMNGEAAPDSSVVIGELWTVHEPPVRKISYESTLNLIRKTVSYAGGNGFYVMTHRKPNHIGTFNHYIEGLVLLTKDTTIYNKANNPFSMSYAEYRAELKRNEVSPHYLHVDFGPSYFGDGRLVLSETEQITKGSFEMGYGMNLSYEYLIPGFLGFGVVYNNHFSKASVADCHGGVPPSYTLNSTIHSVVPVMTAHGSTRKSFVSMSVGVGYKWYSLNKHYASPTLKSEEIVKSSPTLYVSAEYEYRVAHNWGVSGRLFLNDSFAKDKSNSPDNFNMGTSLGINYHF